MAESANKLSPLKRFKTLAARKSEDGSKDGSWNFYRQLSLRVPKKRSTPVRGDRRPRRHSDGDEEGRDRPSDVKDTPKGRSGLSARGTQHSVVKTEENVGTGGEINRTDLTSGRKSPETNTDELNLSSNKKEGGVIKPKEDEPRTKLSEITQEKFLEEKDPSKASASKKKGLEIKNDESNLSESFQSKSPTSPKTKNTENPTVLSACEQVTPSKGDRIGSSDDVTNGTPESTPTNDDNETSKRGEIITKLATSNLRRRLSQRKPKSNKTENSSESADKVMPTSSQGNVSIETELKQSSSKMAGATKVKGDTYKEDTSDTTDTISTPEKTLLEETSEDDSKSSKTNIITETASNIKRRVSYLSKSNKPKQSHTVKNEDIPSSPKLDSSVQTGDERDTRRSEQSGEQFHVQKTRLDHQGGSLEEKKDEVDMGIGRNKSVRESVAEGKQTTKPKEQWRKVSSLVRSGSKLLPNSIKSKVLKDRTHSEGRYGNEVNDPILEEQNVPGDTVKGDPNNNLTSKEPETDVPQNETTNDAPKLKKPKKLDIAPTDKSQERATHYKLLQDTTKLNKEWVDAQEKLDSFLKNALRSLSEGVEGEQNSHQGEIMTSHWADEKLLKTCPGCEKSFSVRSKKNFKKKNKPDHCRKCGRVFCKNCLQNKRKLNFFAQYDPFGKEYPVCSECYQPQTAIPTFGMTVSHTEDFKKYREGFTKHGRDVEVDIKEFRFNPTSATCIRQSKRLVGGYRRQLQDKDLSTVLDLSNVSTKVPDWQKAPTWVDPKSQEGVGCQLCRSGRLDTVHNCRLCGRRVCSQDSSKNFMLYVPDKDTSEYSGDDNPLWKMIQIVGCPEREPAEKLYLRICFNCQEKLEILQEKLYQQMMVTIAPDYEKCESTVLEIHRKTQEMKKIIQTLLPQFREKVNNLISDPTNIPSGTVKDITKQQDDLMEQFPRYLMAVEKLHEMSPQTEQQLKLVRNLLLEKQAFYKENVTTFRLSVRQLVEVLPNEVMQEIKDMVNKDVINNTYNDLTQLAFEIDNISKKYQLSRGVADAVNKAKEICEGELKPMILKRIPGDTTEIWRTHKKNQEDFAKSRAESDGRFLQPNESKIKEEREYLPKYIKREALQRVSYSSLQLKAKSSNRNFKNTKMALETLLAQCR